MSHRIGVWFILCVVFLVPGTVQAITYGYEPPPDDMRFDAVGAIIYNPNGLSNSGSCTLIHSNVVVTARHLFASDANPMPSPSGYFVRFRRHTDGTLGTKAAGVSSFHQVGIIAFDDNVNLDIVVATLAEPVTHIQPIRPLMQPDVMRYDRIYFAGWGSIGTALGTGDRGWLRLSDAYISTQPSFELTYIYTAGGGLNTGDSGGAALWVDHQGQLRILGHTPYSSGTFPALWNLSPQGNNTGVVTLPNWVSGYNATLPPLPEEVSQPYYAWNQPGVTGIWHTAGNWVGGIPVNTISRDVHIDSGGYAIVHTNSPAQANKLFLGYRGTGHVIQYGGSNILASTVNNHGEGLYMGFYEGASGSYVLEDGWTRIPAVVAGFRGHGAFLQSGGTNHVNNGLIVGAHASATGSYTQTGGQLIAQRVSVGDAGDGVFEQTGGTHTIWHELVLGERAGSEGTYRLTTNATLSAMEATVGKAGRGTLLLDGDGVEMKVSRAFSIGPQGRVLSTGDDPVIHFTALGSVNTFKNKSVSPTNLSGLAAITLRVGAPVWYAELIIEVGGRDVGAIDDGFEDNFALGGLVVHRYSSATLADGFDNQPEWAGNEALYVDTVELQTNTVLNLNGLNLYCRHFVNNGGEVRNNGGNLVLMDGSVPALIGFDAATGGGTAQAIATLGADFDPPLADADALNELYITIDGNATGTSPGSADRVASYTVTFPEAGEYHLYARVYIGPGGGPSLPGAADDSMFYGKGFGVKASDDADGWVLVNNIYETLPIERYIWVNLSEYVGRNAGTPVSFTVPEDELTQIFQIGGREDGFRLDAFAFGSSSFNYQDAALNASVSNVSYTLTIVSAHGSPEPSAGLFHYPAATILTNSVGTDLVITNGGTRYAAGGWVLQGVSPIDGDETHCIITLTNHAELTWQWVTEHRVETIVDGEGSITPDGEFWVTNGVAVTLTAEPAHYHHFYGWGGDATGSGPVVNVTVSGPMSVEARFAPDVTENTGTPLFWLALHDLTMGGMLSFEDAALDDADRDGVPNWAEYRAGTDPRDPRCSFEIVEFKQGADLVLQWRGSANSGVTEPFMIQHRRLLSEGSWTNLLSVPRGAGMTQQWTVAEHPVPSNGFFRIVVPE